jgi:transposase
MYAGKPGVIAACMANVLPVQTQQAILALHAQGRSIRQIARDLDIHRNTVRGYLAAQAAPPNCTTNPTPGSDPNCTTPTAGSPGPLSLCEPHAPWIRNKVESGLSAQRIFQDLRSDFSFQGSYQSVKRFVRSLKDTEPERVWRIEVQPGEEAQVDFGLGAPLTESDGRKRRTWVFRIVLSFSRKAYSESVLHQDTETFLRALENAFRAFLGVPRTLNLDNLKAAVLKADWYDPELNPKLVEFARHYRVAVIPCRPRTPEHKGKVERGVGYVKSNALAGRCFDSIAAQNQFLREWEATVADLRIHGTTKRQVAQLFAEEQPHLQALPASLFPCFSEAKRRVHRDSFVEVAKAYYDVPPEYIGCDVWVRWDSRELRVFNQRLEQVAFHSRIQPGRFTKSLGLGGGASRVQATLDYWGGRAAELGPSCQLWAKGLIQHRQHEGIRSLMGLVQLLDKHSPRAINAACARACACELWRLRDVRTLLTSTQTPVQPQLPFNDAHPVLRDLTEYADFINNHCKT